ncbi:MAG TPA: hypothetical protein VFT91_08855 [Dehalococcoidia bacterium]|nr:hypothetical protein [Dehalococcoidia bacterium]
MHLVARAVTPTRRDVALFLMGLVVLVGAAMFLATGSSTAALAAGNPSGTGQPGAECGEPGATALPAGFETGGFAHAETVYAGSGASASHAASDAAVSQYDVACYQLTSGH